MSDIRKNRVQPTRLAPGYFPLNIHKSMFINDLMITIPKYYVVSWGLDVVKSHHKNNCKWEADMKYYSPKEAGEKKSSFKGCLFLSHIKDRSKESSYRLKWDIDFAIKLAQDYPKSFVRSLEFHIGDEEYKESQFTEFDIGGFKEQLQVKISWEKNKLEVVIREYFKVKRINQDFPNIYSQLSSYLIADYLLSDEKQILRRIQTSKWKPRTDVYKELKENNIYVLLNRAKGMLYFGETKQSLSRRYPLNQRHHSFDDWDEYCVVNLPPETTNHTRLLIERVLISVGSNVFKNNFNNEQPLIDGEVLRLANKKK